MKSTTDRLAWLAAWVAVAVASGSELEHLATDPVERRDVIVSSPERERERERESESLL